MSDAFADLGLAPALVAGLAGLGYEEPTPIQREAIPHLLAGRDLLGQAATGTGKTAAFALPLLQRLPTTSPRPSAPGILVLVPTRELAMQVAEAFHRYGRPLGTIVVPIYGGQEFSRQIRALSRGVHVVVATPGRALDHLRRKSLDLSDVSAVVLDEADEMLDMGFAEDIETILEAAPAARQTALFSATIPARIKAIAERHLDDPHRIAIAREKTAAGSLPRIRQVAYVVPRAQKVTALGRILDVEAPALALVFCRTRTEVDALAETLTSHGYRAEALHGGMTQEQRDRVMKRTRGGGADLLIATDVAARGLDIEQISHVINYNVPESPAAYEHRIGRTGRAGREGVAITLVEPREHRMLRSIEQVTRQKIEVGTVPTIRDVRARRLELTRNLIRERIQAGALDGVRAVVESLADEFDLMDISMAAVQLAHEAGAGGGTGADEAETDIPPLPETPAPSRRSARPAMAGPSDHPALRKSRPKTGTGRIYVGAGRKANMRPADLVGAIVNEAGIEAGAIGSIEIADTYSLVELPDSAVDDVIAALRDAKVKGRRLTVRRDKVGAPKRPPRSH
jgi:ATP-dependent RNA helicase DeaD